jgi:hypothetical protein
MVSGSASLVAVLRAIPMPAQKTSAAAAADPSARGALIRIACAFLKKPEYARRSARLHKSA